MTEALYLNDSYLKEFEAAVTEINGIFIVLDKTAFYPVGGGQPEDTGKFISNGKEYSVKFVKKISSNISHEVDQEGLKVGDKVQGIIDWDRRYRLMKTHTAAHIISGVFHHNSSVKITGGDLSLEKGRIDFNIENFDRNLIEEYIKKSNDIIQKDLPIKVSYMNREEANKDPTLFKLAKELPSTITNLRILEIVGFDKQADGGTHVRSTKEVGKIELISIENKGKNNRRLYYRIMP